MYDSPELKSEGVKIGELPFDEHAANVLLLLREGLDYRKMTDGANVLSLGYYPYDYAPLLHMVERLDEIRRLGFSVIAIDFPPSAQEEIERVAKGEKNMRNVKFFREIIKYIPDEMIDFYENFIRQAYTLGFEILAVAHHYEIDEDKMVSERKSAEKIADIVYQKVKDGEKVVLFMSEDFAGYNIDKENPENKTPVDLLNRREEIKVVSGLFLGGSENFYRRREWSFRKVFGMQVRRKFLYDDTFMTRVIREVFYDRLYPDLYNRGLLAGYDYFINLPFRTIVGKR